MANPNEETFTTTTDQIKQQNNRFTLSKADSDLFDDNKNIVEKIIRVRRVKLPNNGENWKVFSDDEVVFLVEGIKLSKKEKTFLRTAEGVLFLIAEAKLGIKSLNALKKSLSKHI